MEQRKLVRSPTKVLAALLIVLGGFAIAVIFLPRNDSPEKLSIDLMKRQLSDKGQQISLAETAKCTNELGSDKDHSNYVEFYRTCVIEIDGTSEKMIFRIAFNSRGSIEFWEGNTVQK